MDQVNPDLQQVYVLVSMFVGLFLLWRIARNICEESNAEHEEAEAGKLKNDDQPKQAIGDDGELVDDGEGEGTDNADSR